MIKLYFSTIIFTLLTTWIWADPPQVGIILAQDEIQNTYAYGVLENGDRKKASICVKGKELTYGLPVNTSIPTTQGMTKINLTLPIYYSPIYGVLPGDWITASAKYKGSFFFNQTINLPRDRESFTSSTDNLKSSFFVMDRIADQSNAFQEREETSFLTQNGRIIPVVDTRREKIEGIKFTIRTLEPITFSGKIEIKVKLKKRHLAIAFIAKVKPDGKVEKVWDKIRKYKWKSKKYVVPVNVQPGDIIVVGLKSGKYYYAKEL